MPHAYVHAAGRHVLHLVSSTARACELFSFFGISELGYSGRITLHPRLCVERPAVRVANHSYSNYARAIMGWEIMNMRRGCVLFCFKTVCT